MGKEIKSDRDSVQTDRSIGNLEIHAKWQLEPVHDLESVHLYGFMGDCGTGSPDRSVESPALAAPPETASGLGWKKFPKLDGPAPLTSPASSSRGI